MGKVVSNGSYMYKYRWFVTAPNSQLELFYRRHVASFAWIDQPCIFWEDATTETCIHNQPSVVQPSYMASTLSCLQRQDAGMCGHFLFCPKPPYIIFLMWLTRLPSGDFLDSGLLRSWLDFRTSVVDDFDSPLRLLDEFSDSVIGNTIYYWKQII